MSFLSGDVAVAASSVTSSSATKEFALGARAKMPDGRTFRYCLAGGTALVPGKLQQAPAQITNHQNLTPAAAAIGATSVTVTLGATAATANQYAEGWVVVTVTPGQGYQYKIASHPAADASATLVLTLEDPIAVALTASSRVDLVLNPYSGVIVNPSTATSAPVGVAVYPVTAAQYGWIQTGGSSVILADGALAVGTNVAASNAVAGAVEAATGVQAAIGEALTGVADTEYGAVRLLLDS
jgi:hypothetical protein